MYNTPEASFKRVPDLGTSTRT